MQITILLHWNVLVIRHIHVIVTNNDLLGYSSFCSKSKTREPNGTETFSESVLTCTHNICFEQNMKIVNTNQLKTVICTALKNPCMLQGRVFVMDHLTPGPTIIFNI